MNDFLTFKTQIDFIPLVAYSITNFFIALPIKALNNLTFT